MWIISSLSMTIKPFVLVAVLVCGLGAVAQSTPQIHGTLRAGYDWEPSQGMSRFQVRNARLSVEGSLTEALSYKVQTDFCDQGKIKILDAQASYAFAGKFSVTLGQTLVPGIVEGARAPHLLWFSSRSLISKTCGPRRAVGAKLRYNFGPAFAEVGAFNAHPMADHNVWERQMLYAGKLGTLLGNFNLELGAESAYPDSVRITRLDAYAKWTSGRWRAEGEYLYSIYAHDAYKAGHAWFVSANYDLPLHLGDFSLLSFQGRWDGMTDASDGKADAAGLLKTTWERRNRLTLGSTISHIGPKGRCDFKINYEWMFYPWGYVAPSGERSKLIAEICVRF